MSEKEERLIDKFSKTIPKLKETDQVYLLGLAEGMALAKSKVVKEEVPDEELIKP